MVMCYWLTTWDGYLGGINATQIITMQFNVENPSAMESPNKTSHDWISKQLIQVGFEPTSCCVGYHRVDAVQFTPNAAVKIIRKLLRAWNLAADLRIISMLWILCKCVCSLRWSVRYEENLLLLIQWLLPKYLLAVLQNHCWISVNQLQPHPGFGSILWYHVKLTLKCWY